MVRRIADTLYSDTPANEPGNDDLGALSSWYVWAAIGLYPVTPGSADLALASPLFPAVSVTLPDGQAARHARAVGIGVDALHPLPDPRRGQRGQGHAHLCIGSRRVPDRVHRPGTNPGCRRRSSPPAGR